MKGKSSTEFSDYLRLFWVFFVLSCVVLATVFVSRTSASKGGVVFDPPNFSPIYDANFPKEFDLRAIHGTPRGTDLPIPGLPGQSLVQLKALNALRNKLGLAINDARLLVNYNGLTATPRHIASQEGYLSAPSSLPAEVVALDFIRQNREVFRFDENDLNSLKLISRATSDNGTTTMVFNQQIGGKTVYHGDVMVNVAKNGQILNVGGDSYPRLTLANLVVISPAQAIQNAAARLNVSGFSPASLGSVQVLATYGSLAPEYVTGEKFAHGTAFSDDIVVTQVIFPMGGTARHAYKFTLTTPQYLGIMWQHFVDAQTGETLRRSSLTAFQNFGTSGGGVGTGRKPTFRPDVQNLVESFNNAGTAQGKVFDTLPTALSGQRGYGRSTRTGAPGSYVYTAPTYAPDLPATSVVPARSFQFGLVDARNESASPFGNGLVRPTFSQTQLPGFLGQVIRGFPDAANPSSSSPFGWFYLPTGSGGAEITEANANRTTTRALGYTIDAAASTVGPSAKARNASVPANSPTGDGEQPFSADLTGISNTPLPDGRSLSSVFQSKYAEGNNVGVSDDRANDDEATNGVKGYSPNRNFTASYFDYIAEYEYGGANATAGTQMPVNFLPASTEPDVFPGTVSLFYFNNVMHDYLYSIGFNEQFYNFQMDNFGKGGAGGDQIVAQVQDGSGVNNANMGTPDEGGNPRMQMYLFTESTTSGFGRRSDGDFDFDVVAHEHFHGVSNRSAGKGMTNCLGIALVGESGGMGEGWSDYIAASMTDDDAAGEYVTGQQDIAIRRFPLTNYRYSYGSINDVLLSVRRTNPATVTVPDDNAGGVPFEVHDIGEVWAATLWDMRELMIVKQKVGASFPGVFFDGSRRFGGGANFFVGERQVQSVDAQHPINYRNGVAPFMTSVAGTPTINPIEHIVRPGLIAAENVANPNRNGPLATAVASGARIADRIMLRGLQLAPCNPSFVEMRDSMLMADRELTGGENQAIIWRAFASHGVGAAARSTGGTGGVDTNGGAQSAPTVVEDYTVPAGVTACELSGPLPEPTFSVVNNNPNAATITITAVTDATSYVITRSTSPGGPFTTIATVTGLTYEDNDNGAGLIKNQTYYYQIHAARNAQCVGTAVTTQSVFIALGTAPAPAPIFTGVAQVSDPKLGSTLNLNWSPATSTNPTAAIVYDIYRVTSITTTANGQADSTTAPTFVPSAANRVAAGISGNCLPNQSCSYADTGRTLGQIYYYIVQARDANNGKLDTNDTGNRTAKFSAPTTNAGSQLPFPIENFEAATANTRFVPALIDQTTPNVATPVWQRVSNADLRSAGKSLVATGAMYAPDFDPTNDGTGAPSNIVTVIGPITLTPSSILEFDSRFATEFGFDGGVIELSIGAPTFNANPFPDNLTTFDLNYFIFENGYTGKLDGTLAGPVALSPLQGRFAFAGTRATSHVRAALGSFAGGALNPTAQPVYLRFRMASDVGTSPGAGSGWYVDNLVINNFFPPTAAPASVSGQVNSSGRGLRGVTVSLFDLSSGETIYATTNAKGLYRFNEVPVGENYIITPHAIGYAFSPNEKILSLTGEATDVDFNGIRNKKGR